MRKHLRKLTREGKPIPATLDMSAGIALLPLADTSESVANTAASNTSLASVESDLIRFATPTTATSTADSNTVTLPVTKGPVRKAANLAELRRYFKAAEEAANQVINEQIQIKHTLTQQTTAANTDPVHLAQHTATTNELDYQNSLMVELVEASTRSVYSPTRVLALQKANSNTLFREKLQIKLHNNNIPNTTSSNLQHSSVPVPDNPTPSSKPLNYENMNDGTSRKRTHTTMETESGGVSVAV